MRCGRSRPARRSRSTTARRTTRAGSPAGAARRAASAGCSASRRPDGSTDRRPPGRDPGESLSSDVPREARAGSFGPPRPRRVSCDAFRFLPRSPMPSAARVLADRRHLWAFIAGSLAVTAGVLLHLPMFWMGRGNGFRLADMPMDAEMTWGMVLIVVGICVSGYGLLPKRLAAADGAPHEVAISAPEDAPLGPRHWRL